MYVCTVITFSRVQIDRVRSPILFVRGQLNRGKILCPRSRLRIWSRETGLVVPSCVSLLILHTQTEFGAYSRDSSRCPRRRPFIFTTIRHQVSPEFIRSRNCVQMAFTAESPLLGQSRGYRVTQLRTDGVHCQESARTGPVALKVVRITGAAFLVHHHGPITTVLLFLYCFFFCLLSSNLFWTSNYTFRSICRPPTGVTQEEGHTGFLFSVALALIF